MSSTVLFFSYNQRCGILNEERLFLIIVVCGSNDRNYRLKSTVDVGTAMLEMGQKTPVRGWPSLIYR